MSNTDPADILLNTITLDENIIDVVPKKPKPKVKPTRKKLEAFTYTDYVNGNIIMKSYTIPILKQVCKFHKLHISGKKGVLIERITTLFERIKSAIIVQKYTRRQFVNKIIQKNREFSEKRNMCTNTTDFSTMEPLNEISKEYFYCYTDIDEFVYGFDITSLIEMIRKTRKIFNPYTRTPITKRHKNEIINLYNLSLLVYRKMRETNEPYINLIQNNHRLVHNRYRNLINRITNEFNNREVSSYLNYRPIANIETIPTIYHEQYQELENMRQLSIAVRINSLFLEIDQLGNYTDQTWFTNLTHMQYAQLYRCFYDIWNFRGQISYEVKNDICPIHGPFDGIFPNTVRHMDLSTTTLKTACLIVFENLVYSGINVEIRKIGTLIALTALTVISHPARTAMPWLYESMIY
tara:strand:+ start:1366 stop:2589 length:1224 start_codon:yes stop_codon:yes gene_type:complete